MTRRHGVTRVLSCWASRDLETFYASRFHASHTPFSSGVYSPLVCMLHSKNTVTSQLWDFQLFTIGGSFNACLKHSFCKTCSKYFVSYILSLIECKRMDRQRNRIALRVLYSPPLRRLMGYAVRWRCNPNQKLSLRYLTFGQTPLLCHLCQFHGKVSMLFMFFGAQVHQQSAPVAYIICGVVEMYEDSSLVSV